MSDIEKLIDDNQNRAREDEAYAAGIRWAKREEYRKRRLNELTLYFWLTNILTGACATVAGLQFLKNNVVLGISLLLLTMFGVAIAARLEERVDAYR